MALTGYYKTLMRPRTHRPLSMLKYDPVGTFYLRVGLGEGERMELRVQMLIYAYSTEEGVIS